MTPPPLIVMIASENDALKGGKVGGLADVVRDLPRSLGDMGCNVNVITPAYGFLQKENPSEHHATIDFPFGGKRHSADIFRVTAKYPHPKVTHFIVEHPELRGNAIYYNDPSATPFLRDAEKYALFCSAAGQFLCRLDAPFVLHLHDWHAGMFFLLRELHPEFQKLKGIRTLFTIHNLAVQGTRPFTGKSSSVERWFPELFAASGWIDLWRDPQWKLPCFNPLLAGIRCADEVNTVSPGYAGEILRPSDHGNGFYGGEGLEPALNEKKAEGKLHGILNGCEYPKESRFPRLTHVELIEFIYNEILRAGNLFNHDIAARVGELRNLHPSFILTGVTRIVEQKVRLFLEQGSGDALAIDGIHDILLEMNGACIIIGNGVQEYEEMFEEISGRNQRFIFLKGYSEPISRALYANGTFFLMPSSFEPCGISQMIAMREGQPCIVHAVGGLKDTVIDGVNGFTFNGKSLREQVDAFIGVTGNAIRSFLEDKSRWNAIRNEAMAARFTWETSAKRYLELLSQP